MKKAVIARAEAAEERRDIEARMERIVSRVTAKLDPRFDIFLIVIDPDGESVRMEPAIGKNLDFYCRYYEKSPEQGRLMGFMRRVWSD